MSPFWKNVNEELVYQGKNIKTLSALTGIPYTTITNARNRENSIPPADVALKIAKVLNKPLEMLLGTDNSLPENGNFSQSDRTQEKLQLFNKYEYLINDLEICRPDIRDNFIRTIHSVCKETPLGS